MIGTRVGNWLIEAELGRGFMGTVYKARAVDPKPDAPAAAAVKVLTHPLARDAAFLQRFPAEMLALRRLTHPNLARFYDSGVHAGLAYYASEFVDGTDLGTVLKQREKTPATPGLSWRDEVLSIAAQAARALKHGHHRSLLHRDLKPANVLLTKEGTVKLTDFGVAKVYNLPPLSLPGDPTGTAGYLAPEHFTGKPVTRRSDLYALGGVLYTLLTGRPPFAAGTAAELMHKHCYMLPDRPANFVQKLPHDVDELVCELLAKDPARRPASAAAFLEELDRVRGRLDRKGERIVFPAAPDDPTGQHAALPADADRGNESDGRDRRDRLLKAAALGTAFLLVVGVILFVFFRPRPSAESLVEAAAPLMASDDPADWERAADEYLDPLARWHPDAYPAEQKEWRARVQAWRRLGRGIEEGRRAAFNSEAERLYSRGLRQAQDGDAAAARATWQAVATVFAHVEGEKAWVTLAKAGLQKLAERPPTAADGGKAITVKATAAAAAAKLRGEGKAAEAAAVEAAAGELYR